MLRVRKHDFVRASSVIPVVEKLAPERDMLAFREGISTAIEDALKKIPVQDNIQQDIQRISDQINRLYIPELPQVSSEIEAILVSMRAIVAAITFPPYEAVVHRDKEGLFMTHVTLTPEV